MPILFGKHRADRRQCDFRRRADGIGREALSKEKPGTGSHSQLNGKQLDRPKTAEMGLAGIASEEANAS